MVWEKGNKIIKFLVIVTLIVKIKNIKWKCITKKRSIGSEWMLKLKKQQSCVNLFYMEIGKAENKNLSGN